jgi:hypothetical protein
MLREEIIEEVLRFEAATGLCRGFGEALAQLKSRR